MDQAAQLLVERCRQTGMVVAQRVDCDTGQAVEIATAVLIEQLAAFAVGKRHGLPGVVIHQVRHDPLRAYIDDSASENNTAAMIDTAAAQF
jgi:hypothetical protein